MVTLPPEPPRPGSAVAREQLASRPNSAARAVGPRPPFVPTPSDLLLDSSALDCEAEQVALNAEDLFEEIIRRDRTYGPLLREIKVAYDIFLRDHGTSVPSTAVALRGAGGPRDHHGAGDRPRDHGAGDRGLSAGASPGGRGDRGPSAAAPPDHRGADAPRGRGALPAQPPVPPLPASAPSDQESLNGSTAELAVDAARRQPWLETQDTARGDFVKAKELEQENVALRTLVHRLRAELLEAQTGKVVQKAHYASAAMGVSGHRAPDESTAPPAWSAVPADDIPPDPSAVAHVWPPGSARSDASSLTSTRLPQRPSTSALPRPAAVPTLDLGRLQWYVDDGEGDSSSMDEGSEDQEDCGDATLRLPPSNRVAWEPPL
eukprot:gnl/TRDRNA2_/TRDRNA2_162566_c1_seq2.p1 gnl/TRDRNA2_/TRDRNA2_162566_c1~~gnl/TRDRNA2_/TRDRNA2_162566_c1_seq2.p1  ORF type:complete len:376 (+),score=59.37 gnl/TRDRNA2_/TRDRNA2_162566_c1_seq2:766-1893(+)